MSTLAPISNVATRRALGDICLSFATLAINIGGAATIKTTGITTYAVDGVLYQKAALAAQSIAVTHDLLGNPVATGMPAYVQPALSTVYYVIALNAAGTVASVQGGFNGQIITLPAGVSMTSKGEMPSVPPGFAPIGVMKVVTGAATTFTPGTTVLDAALVTVTYTNVALLPTVNP